MTDTATDPGTRGVTAPGGARRAARPHPALALALALATGATLLLGAGAGAQESDPEETPVATARPTATAAPTPTPAPTVGLTATATPAPTLTMAPLVTLPPISSPRVVTPTDLADGYALGNVDAPVLVEVWEDFQCPYCQRFSMTIKPLIVETYVTSGQVRFVFRDLPFIGEESYWASVAASLAADQDLFWPYHDHLFANLLGENVGSYDLDRLLAMGELVGLDMETFVEGLQVDAARERFALIQSRAHADAGALGINATPTVVINGVPATSPDWDTVRAAIDTALGGS